MTSRAKIYSLVAIALRGFEDGTPISHIQRAAEQLSALESVPVPPAGFFSAVRWYLQHRAAIKRIETAEWCVYRKLTDQLGMEDATP